MKSDTAVTATIPLTLDLVKRAQQGDSEAFAALFHAHKARIYSVCLRMTNNAAEAEDLTQEVFVRLARRPDQNNGDTLEAYVFKIASSVLADWGRNRTSRRFKAHRSLNDIAENVAIPNMGNRLLMQAIARIRVDAPVEAAGVLAGVNQHRAAANARWRKGVV